MMLLALVASAAALAWYVHKKSDWMDEVPWLTLEEAARRATTGDMLLFRNGEAGSLQDVFGTFTHVGVVWERDGKKRVLETHEAGDTRHLGFDAGGVHTYDFVERVGTYGGAVCLLKLHASMMNDAHSNLITSKMPTYVRIPFNSAYHTFYASHCIFGLPRPNAPEKFCSQFAGLVLRDLGILPENQDIDCMAPDSFMDLRSADKPLYTELYRIR